MYPNCNNLFRGGENQRFLSGYTFPRDFVLSVGEASRALGYTLSLKRREIGRKPGPTFRHNSLYEFDVPQAVHHHLTSGCSSPQKAVGFPGTPKLRSRN